jgi:hypothetical protein
MPNMQPRSNTLFHFTKSLEFLKSILLNGFFPRYCREDTSFINVEYVGYPMVCFCDIPITRISDHTSFYGEYGIGLTREWGLRSTLCPIVYTPPSGPITELAKFLVDVEVKPKSKKQKEINDSLTNHFNTFIPLIKPISGKMVVGGQSVEKEFYQENEWRYLPENFRMLFPDDFERDREKLNREIEALGIKFSPNDVRYIFVKSDAELPTIFDFIQNNLGVYPLNDLKILSTRITSIETLSRDL